MSIPTNRQQLIQHFESFPWAYWGTLTAFGDTNPQLRHKRNKPNPYILERRFLRWIRRLAATNQAKVNYVYVIEASSTGQPHVHFQLGPVNVPIARMKSLWVSSGGGKVNLIEPYNSQHGSAYTVKDWFISDHKGMDTRRMSHHQTGASL